MTDKEAIKVEKDLLRAYKMGYAKACFRYGDSVAKVSKDLQMSTSTIRTWFKKFQGEEAK